MSEMIFKGKEKKRGSDCIVVVGLPAAKWVETSLFVQVMPASLNIKLVKQLSKTDLSSSSVLPFK